MKTLAELEEDIYKCSKCGLCQKVCPIYKATGNECMLSRGKFTLLNGVVQKHIKLNDDVMKYVDACLNCNACKNFCPSNIDARKIFRSVKSEYKKENQSLFKRLWYKFNCIKVCFQVLSIFIVVFRFLKLDVFILKNQKIFNNEKSFLKKLFLFALIVNERTKETQEKTLINPKNKTIAYFQGCMNKYINPSSKNAVLNILKKEGYNIIFLDFDCCGMMYYQKGLLDELKKIVNKNLSKLPQKFDFAISDCASCETMLKMYAEFANDENYFMAKKLQESFVNIVEIYNKPKYCETNFTYHKPCNSSQEIEQYLKNNFENYKEMDEHDSCCGFSGDFGIKYRNISKKIAKEKIKNIQKTEADLVLTNCPSCVVGLQRGLCNFGKKDVIVKTVVEFLNENQY